MDSRKASIFQYNIILYHQSRKFYQESNQKRKFYKHGAQKQKDMDIYTLSIKVTIDKSVKPAPFRKNMKVMNG